MENKKQSFASPELETETIESLSRKLLQANTQLTEAYSQLSRAQKERDAMLSNISHDLRAPITAIRSTLDFLLSGQEISEADFRSSLHLMDRRTKILEDLIQDMYYLLCVEDTSRELNLTELEAAPFLEEYYYDALADSRYDGHDLRLDLAPDLNVRIAIDVAKMIRVLDNLFNNAAKYSGEHTTITLSANVREKGRLEISVSDNGCGIPADAIPHLFQRTYTVSGARTPDGSTGSGLGLAIVKAIAERHGGSVRAESEPGRGSSFILSLPCL